MDEDEERREELVRRTLENADEALAMLNLRRRRVDDDGDLIRRTLENADEALAMLNLRRRRVDDDGDLIRRTLENADEALAALARLNLEQNVEIESDNNTGQEAEAVEEAEAVVPPPAVQEAAETEEADGNDNSSSNSSSSSDDGRWNTPNDDDESNDDDEYKGEFTGRLARAKIKTTITDNEGREQTSSEWVNGKIGDYYKNRYRYQFLDGSTEVVVEFPTKYAEKAIQRYIDWVSKDKQQPENVMEPEQEQEPKSSSRPRSTNTETETKTTNTETETKTTNTETETKTTEIETENKTSEANQSNEANASSSYDWSTCVTPMETAREMYPPDPKHDQNLVKVKKFADKNGGWSKISGNSRHSAVVDLRNRVMIELYAQGLSKKEIGDAIGWNRFSKRPALETLVKEKVTKGKHPYPHQPAEDGTLSYLVDKNFFSALGNIRQRPRYSKKRGMCSDCGLPKKTSKGGSCQNRPLGPRFSKCFTLRARNGLHLTESQRLLKEQGNRCGLCEVNFNETALDDDVNDDSDDDADQEMIVLHHNHLNIIEQNRNEKIRTSVFKYRFGAPMFVCTGCNLRVGRLEMQLGWDLNLVADKIEEDDSDRGKIFAKNLRQQVLRTPKPPKQK